MKSPRQSGDRAVSAPHSAFTGWSNKHPIFTPPEPTYPIVLTPRNPYVVGVASLVFAGGNINPADDKAWFPGNTMDSQELGPLGIPQEVVVTRGEPRPDTGVTTWFRPVELNRQYIVEFNCRGYEKNGSFWIYASEGPTETIDVVMQPDALGSQLLPYLFVPENQKWFAFGLVSDADFDFLSTKIAQLP